MATIYLSKSLIKNISRSIEFFNYQSELLKKGDIEDVIYVYNKENPLNVDKSKAQKQYDLAQKIRNKKSYKRL